MSEGVNVTKGAGLTDSSVCLSEGATVTKGAGLTDRSIVLPKMRSLFTLFSCLKLMTFFLFHQNHKLLASAVKRLIAYKIKVLFA